MLKQLLKFSDSSSIFISSNYAYSYNGNTVAYFKIDTNIEDSIEIPDAKDYQTIEECINSKKKKKDDTPFTFDFDSETTPKEISSNQFVKMVSMFTKYYNKDDYRPELTGLHIRNGVLFASDSIIMRLRRTEMFGKDTNMIVDVNPILDYIGIEAKKIKSTSKSLFASKKIKNDNIILSSVSKDGNDALKIKYKDLNFIVISIGESKVSFEFIKKINPTDKIKFQRKDLINNITTLLNEEIDYNKDYVKDYIRFNLKGDLELSNYVYYKNGHKIVKGRYDNQSDNKIESFTLNGNKLLTILKTIESDIVYIHYDENGHITKVTPDSKTDELLLIAQTTYR